MIDHTEFAAFVKRQVGRGGVQNIVMQVQSRDARIDYAAAAGLASAQAATPMTVDTPYFIASISKMYTAAMVMQLYEQGALDLDQPLSSILPASMLEGIHRYQGRDYSQALRVAHLISQTSGLPDYFEDKPKGGQSLFDGIKAGAPDRAYTLEELLAIVRAIPAKFEPGAKQGRKAHYSDTNYHLLGVIIETVTGQSYAQNLEQRITTPLGLQHTYAFDARQAQGGQPPAMICFKDRVLDLPLFLSSHLAEGGIVATAAENLRFLRAFFDGELFDKKQFERMTGQWNGIFFPLQYGYGMMRFKMPRILSPFQPSLELIGHSGSSGSFAFYSPERELYFVGTINQAAAPGKPFRLMLQLANMLR